MLKQKIKLALLLAAAVIFVVSCDNSSKSSELPAQKINEPVVESSLKSLVVGVAATSGNEFSEQRDSFTVDEQVALRGFWKPESKNYKVLFEWINPEKKIVYSKEMEIEQNWTRTFSYFRGKMPLNAGEWTVRVKRGGKVIGMTTFSVVRNRSEIPFVAQMEAYNTEKVSLEEGKLITEKVRCFAEGRCDTEAVISSLPQSLAEKKVGLAASVFRKAEVTDLVFSPADKMSDALRSLLSKIKPDPAPAAVELSVLHSQIEIKSTEAVVSMKMKEAMGFSLTSGDKKATILPTQIARYQIEDGEGVVRQLSVDAGLPEHGWKSAKLTAFKTQDFLFNDKMTEPKQIAFSRTVVPIETTTRQDLIKAVDNAMNWYMTNQINEGEQSGRYMYTFFVSKDLEPNDDWGLRNLNAIFVIAEIAKDKKDKKLTESVKRAIDVFRSKLVEGHGGKYLDWPYFRKVSSIAGTAFLLGAMAEINDPSYKDDMKKMADAIISLQEPSGKFKTDFYKPLRDVDQLYYPGETILMLMRYYKISKYAPVLESAKKAFPFYREYWKTADGNKAPFVPWQVRAYQEVYMYDKNPDYAKFVFDMSDWLLKRYRPLGPDALPGRQGALNSQFASTGVYTEGFGPALVLARELNDKAHIEAYTHMLRGALPYLLGLQFKEEDMYRVKRPSKVLGALATRPDNDELRLDATYHAISGIHYSTKIFTDEQWNAVEWK
ncbi:hypothetical protein J5834_06790 [bacterium]|nr:hypothetical protein [bacterium]